MHYCEKCDEPCDCGDFDGEFCEFCSECTDYYSGGEGILFEDEYPDYSWEDDDYDDDIYFYRNL